MKIRNKHTKEEMVAYKFNSKREDERCPMFIYVAEQEERVYRADKKTLVVLIGDNEVNVYNGDYIVEDKEQGLSVITRESFNDSFELA